MPTGKAGVTAADPSEVESAPLRSFIIHFSEKEGTTAGVQLIDRLSEVSVLNTQSRAWEPLSSHEVGPMRARDSIRFLDAAFGRDDARARDLYTRSSVRTLSPIPATGGFGFKWRMAPARGRTMGFGIPGLRGAHLRLRRAWFERALSRCLQRNRVVMFVAVRQDLLRWSLSKYRDLENPKSHLQFRVQSGAVKREELEKLHVDVEVFGGIVDRCRAEHVGKQRRVEAWRRLGLDVVPLRYEDFLHDKPGWLRQVTDAVEVDVTDAELQQAIEAGSRLKKVHSNDISTFVSNHEEVMARFGDAWFGW